MRKSKKKLMMLRCSRAPQAVQHIEAAAAQLYAALKVNDVQCRAELPMLLGLKVKLLRLAFTVRKII